MPWSGENQSAATPAATSTPARGGSSANSRLEKERKTRKKSAATPMIDTTEMKFTSRRMLRSDASGQPVDAALLEHEAAAGLCVDTARRRRRWPPAAAPARRRRRARRACAGRRRPRRRSGCARGVTTSELPAARSRSSISACRPSGSRGATRAKIGEAGPASRARSVAARARELRPARRARGICVSGCSEARNMRCSKYAAIRSSGRAAPSPAWIQSISPRARSESASARAAVGAPGPVIRSTMVRASWDSARWRDRSARRASRPDGRNCAMEVVTSSRGTQTRVGAASTASVAARMEARLTGPATDRPPGRPRRILRP